MKIRPVALLYTLMIVAFALTSCVGGRTEPGDKHPDKWERKDARYNARHNGRQF